MRRPWAGGWVWTLVAGASIVVLVALGIGQWIDGFSGTATAAQILSLAPWAISAARWGRENQASSAAVEPLSVTWGATPVPDDLLQGLYAAVTRELPGLEAAWPARFGLPTHWRAADQDLAGEWHDQVRSGTQEPGFLMSEAGREGIAAEYLRLPSKRLVILGGAGAGKTTLATRLILEMLATGLVLEQGKYPAVSGQVPVPVRVDTWNPALITFGGWFRDQLTSGYAQDAACSFLLAASHQVIPVLDGFDELAPDLGPLALKQLRDTERPLVLLSRTEEYRSAVQASGGALKDAAAIVLEPRQGSDPCSPLDEGSSAAQEDVEDRLPRELVTVAYESTGRPGERSWTAGQAERWLGFLARHARGATSQVCWWQLEKVAPVQYWTGALVCAALVGTVFGLAPILIFGSWLSGGTTVTVGAVGGFLGLVNGALASQTLPTPGMRPLARLLRRWLGGAMVGFLMGVAFALLRTAIAKYPDVVAQDAGLAKALFFFPLLSGWVHVGTDLIRRSEKRIDLPAASSPGGIMRADRAATISDFVLLSVVFGGSIGIWAALVATGMPGHMSFTQSFVRGFMLGVIYAAVHALTARSWSRWNIFGRFPLALLRRLPWRTITFLEDARKKGILRHAGLAYEFRTEGLHRYLAAVRTERSKPVMVAIVEWVADTMFDLPASTPEDKQSAPVGFDNPE